MIIFDNKNAGHSLPVFSLDIDPSKATAIYSDVDAQVKLIRALEQNPEVHVFHYKEALYERLSVQENIRFFHKWFNCQIPIPEILVRFHLQDCANKPSENVMPHKFIASSMPSIT